MTGRLVKAIRAAGSLAALIPGAAYHLVKGSTPEAAYQGMVRLFCVTRGVSNDLVHEAIRRFRGSRTLPTTRGVLGDLQVQDIARIKTLLQKNGYYVFPRRLSDAAVDELLRFAQQAEGKYVPGTERRGEEDSARHATRFDRTRPLGVRFDYPSRVLVREPAIQRLMADRSILAIAQAYLGCDPILDLVAMWWHTTASTEPNAEAAQLFHFDMDRIKWLKFFVYLTDVDDRSGPHVFVPGSHRRSGIPWRLLRKGYSRLTDEEVLSHYGENGVHRFMGPRGTIIAEDTRGLHKGAAVVDGDRLVFQLEFVDSLFGGKCSGAPIENPGEEVLRLCRDMPSVFRLFKPV